MNINKDGLRDKARQLAREAGRIAELIGTKTTERVAERSVRLAITGLSRSGKTVAATAIVHNLLCAARHPELMPFLSVVAEGRLLGARFVDRPDLHLPSFPYREVLTVLTGDPPGWPEPTEQINRSRLALRFKPKGTLARVAQATTTLHLDIVDYPGEWLLDLPMLRLSFDEWSAGVFERMHQPPRDRLAREFRAFIDGIDRLTPADDETIRHGKELYQRFLEACEKEGLTLLQPGRFVKPGREVSESAPLMAFFPLPPQSHADRWPLAIELSRRYEAYRDHVVRPFYRNHFARSDRQIVLVDVLKALTEGPHALADMRAALAVVLQSFDHGAAGWLRRIITPRIDRVLFAATQCDRVPNDQHPKLHSLLEELVGEASNDIRFAGARTEERAIAAVRCTQTVEASRDGETITAVLGMLEDGRERKALFPGEVPARFPPPAAWGSLELQLLKFLPSGLQDAGTAGLPHIGLDHALDFLLRDRLQ